MFYFSMVFTYCIKLLCVGVVEPKLIDIKCLDSIFHSQKELITEQSTDDTIC